MPKWRICAFETGWCCRSDTHFSHLVLQSLFAIASPFGFGADGHVELGISEFQVWHHAGQGVPDPNAKRMGFFITTSEAQTLLEFDLSQVSGLKLIAAVFLANWCYRELHSLPPKYSRMQHRRATATCSCSRRASAPWTRRIS